MAFQPTPPIGPNGNPRRILHNSCSCLRSCCSDPFFLSLVTLSSLSDISDIIWLAPPLLVYGFSLALVFWVERFESKDLHSGNRFPLQVIVFQIQYLDFSRNNLDPNSTVDEDG